MVINFCLQHFKTTAHCNKPSADNCDVSNLLSGDPAARRRGFRLEYFLSPPLHVTLHFQVRIELCRVDIELWPCGNAPRRLEILTCSDFSQSSHDQECGQFKLVGRCELREEDFLCFKYLSFKHRAPFTEPPPEPPVPAKQQEFWSRGSQSLSSVAKLRVTLPFSGASTVLGIKSLAVWGIPARCCAPVDLVNLQKAHFDSLQPKVPSILLHSSDSTSASPPIADLSPSKTPIPEEFLDPLTQELMVLPMILPSGMVVDNNTLEEYQKREASWGRLPNDPFTGVPFSKDSKPLPSPLLKSRIDSLMLQTMCPGVGSRNSVTRPLPSRLVAPSVTETKEFSDVSSKAETFVKNIQKVHSASSECAEKLQRHTGYRNKNGSTLNDLKNQFRNIKGDQGSISQYSTETDSITRKRLDYANKRKYCSTNAQLSATTSPKMPRTDGSITQPTHKNFSQASHEQLLSQSLDSALLSALHGLPTYTTQSNLKSDTTRGQSTCGSCSCSLNIYTPNSVTYSFPCGHLLCRTCLHQHTPKPQRLPIPCPTCKVCASPSTITRVHH